VSSVRRMENDHKFLFQLNSSLSLLLNRISKVANIRRKKKKDELQVEFQYKTEQTE
jgi:hypothetical protein